MSASGRDRDRSGHDRGRAGLGGAAEHGGADLLAVHRGELLRDAAGRRAPGCEKSAVRDATGPSLRTAQGIGTQA